MASLKNKSNDWDGVKSPAKQRKRGRPPIQSISDSTSPDDEDSQRKERVRLAQRAYRNRKDMKVDGLNARVARLEYALEQTIKSFTRFQNLAIGVNNIPPKIALELSRTALEIASVAQKAHSGEPLQNAIPDDCGSRKMLDSQDATEDAVEEPVIKEVLPAGTAHISNPSNLLSTSAPKNGFASFGLAKTPSPMSSSTAISTQQNLTLWTPETGRRTYFATKLLRLCLERGVQLITSPTATYDDLHPALSIHLTWVTLDELRIQSMRAMANDLEHPQEDPEPSNPLLYPDMYRSIEGSDGLVMPRMTKSEPQQLVHGRTRTKLGTSLRAFQGEWLEPIDVQEYLEWKGIFLGSSGLEQVLQIAIPETTLAYIWTQDADAIFTEEIQRSRVMSIAWPFDIESQDLGLEVLNEVESQVPELARQNDSLVASTPELPIAAQALQEYQAQSNAAQLNLLNESFPLAYVEPLIGVTLHLDRLMRFLVEAACCIGYGPGIRKEAVEHALRVSIAAY